MQTEIIVAIISAIAAILVAIVTGIFKCITNKTKEDKSQSISGNGNIQAGGDINLSGGIEINAKPTDKRK